MTHLKIIQGNNPSDTEEVSMDIINKLYELAVSGDLDQTSELKGYLHLQVGDRAKIEYLTNMFPNKLFITASNYIIPFEDQNMVTYLNSIGVGSNGVITEADATAATIVANSANTTVTKFNELKYFTQITQSRGGWDSYDSGYVRFYGWTALEEVDISNFTSLGHSEAWGYEDTFSDCTSLKKVTASNKLTKVGVFAFKSCQNLEEITGLSGTILLSQGAFFRCKKLTNESFSNVQILFNVTSDINREHSTFEQTNLITSLTLSDLNTVIPSKAFLSSKIRTINIPSGVYYFAADCFRDSDLAIDASLISNAETYKQYCFAYSKITGTFAPTNLITLEDSSFEGCSSLQGVDFSNAGNLSFLGKYLFYNCNSLTNATLPNSWTTLKEGIFYNCSALTSINLGNITTFESECLRGCTSLQANMPSNIILDGGHGAFQSATGLQFPSQITVSSINSNNRIGSRCFQGATIQEVTIDPSIEILNAWSFENCSSLRKINGLSNIKYIVQGVFKGCTNLEGEIDLSNLVSNYLNERWQNNGQDEYCIDLFSECHKITNVKFGHLVRIMNGYQDIRATFRNCSMLHTVDINSLDYINVDSNNPNQGPFFTTGSGFTCPSMRNFVLRCTTVPTIEQGTASQINMNLFGGSQVTIYVPDSALNDYKTAWAPIASYIKGLSEYVPITS